MCFGSENTDQPYVMDHSPIRQTFEFGNQLEQSPSISYNVKLGCRMVKNVENIAM